MLFAFIGAVSALLFLARVHDRQIAGISADGEAR
jgi:hypothetical protein